MAVAETRFLTKFHATDAVSYQGKLAANRSVGVFGNYQRNNTIENRMSEDRIRLNEARIEKKCSLACVRVVYAVCREGVEEISYIM